jgi:hypothetical protein
MSTQHTNIKGTHPVSAIPSNSPNPLVTNAKNGGTLRRRSQRKQLQLSSVSNRIDISRQFHPKAHT